jgi:hypothetical protein
MGQRRVSHALTYRATAWWGPGPGQKVGTKRGRGGAVETVFAHPSKLVLVLLSHSLPPH